MAPLYPILNKRIPRRVLYIVGMTSMIVAYILLGFFSTNMTVVFIALVLFYIPGTLIQMTAILSLTDSIEYGQLKNGKRNEAVTLSVRPMLDKIGGALSNGITGFTRRRCWHDRQRHRGRYDPPHPHSNSALYVRLF